MYDVVIIGAGTAGLSAGIYCARANMKTLVLEGNMYGGQIVNSPKIENYPGIQSISGFEYSTNLYNQTKSLGAQILTKKVLKVERSENSGFEWKVITAKEEFETHTVIIATGLVHRKPDVPGTLSFEGKGLSYCATCDGAFYKGKDVVVFGGGNTAVADAMFLSNYCNKVHLVHRRDTLRATGTMADTVLESDNVIFHPNCVLNSIKADENGKVSSVVINDKVDGNSYELDVKGIFMAIGQIPSNEIFEGTVDMDDAGYIIADENCLTSAEGIFVAGDCRTKNVRQLTTAASDGAVAAIAAIEKVMAGRS